ncbi:TPA: hypothetical protein U1137_000513 [Streptococcus suis]|nr:hypothetical protein [Streptococcus suis]HEM4742237.1 hypothetical protein [Streptococcus suis]HEM4756930.1 hypothetical protein [Streptococcus suis]HEM4761172.1 hypothetical protein [Streptococcus suis]HEM4784585.1 hypothetical protein [Streptococcus suis]
MSDTITISKTELELMIAEAVARNTLPRKKKDFRDVAIRNEELLTINQKFPKIAERLSRRFASQVTDAPSKDELRLGKTNPNGIYTRRRYSLGYNNYKHNKLHYIQDVSDILRHLSLAVMGATVIKDLDDDEFEHSLEVYSEFKTLFLNLYEERLVSEEKILENCLQN